MKKPLLFLIFFLAGFVLLWWILKTVGLANIGEAFLTFTGPEGIVILLLTLGMLFAAFLRWRKILVGQGIKLPLRVLWRPYIASYAITFFTPMLILGAEFFRAYSLREKHDVDWEKSMASVLIDKLLEYTSSVIVIFTGVIFFLVKIGLPSQKLWVIAGLAFIFLTTILAFFYFKVFKRESIVRIFIKRGGGNGMMELEKEVYRFFKIKNKFMWHAFALSFLRMALSMARVWVLVLFLGKQLGFLSALSILGFYYLALIIPIPASLGTHDALQAFSFGSFGLGAGTGAAFAMIIRGAEIIAALFGAVILLSLGTEFIGNILLGKSKRRLH